MLTFKEMFNPKINVTFEAYRLMLMFKTRAYVCGKVYF
jgi:hypothetical protein